MVISSWGRDARLRLRHHGGRLLVALLAAVFIGLAALVVRQRGGDEAGNQLVVGLQRGAIYALIAVGYTMVYGIIELINFAHGDVFTLSAFYSVFTVAGLDRVGIHLGSVATANLGGLILSLAVIFPLTMLAAGLTGVVVERVAYRPLRDAPRLAPLITAIGVSFLLEGIMYAFFIPPGNAIGGNYPTGQGDWVRGQAFAIGGVHVGWKDVFVVVVAVILMIALQSFIRRGRLGKAMRATAQDREAALLSGININRTIAATFFIGSALAAGGALVYSIYYGLVQWNLGFRFGIIAFTAAVLGGIGNIVGAGLGGFLIGLIEVFSSELIGGQWS
ncbi:MAG: branched-chain amino acid ABC transporter permease, partial [Actinobacteria bacterium]|nr:branched-chain amino acid ABC transporter permease [Actinomycetota bacterium]